MGLCTWDSTLNTCCYTKSQGVCELLKLSGISPEKTVSRYKDRFIHFNHFRSFFKLLQYICVHLFLRSKLRLDKLVHIKCLEVRIAVSIRIIWDITESISQVKVYIRKHYP